MQIIDTKTHGYMDYTMGLVLIAAPHVFNFNTNSLQSTVLYSLGIAALLYSLLTKYELGLIKIIPINIHLMLDTLSGIFLATSPWLLGFSDEVYLPHLLFGLIEIGAAIMTNLKSQYGDFNVYRRSKKLKKIRSVL